MNHHERHSGRDATRTGESETRNVSEVATDRGVALSESRDAAGGDAGVERVDPDGLGAGERADAETGPASDADTASAERRDDLVEPLAMDGLLQVLALVNDAPRTAEEIADACDVSMPTAYRRLSKLEDRELLGKSIRISSAGNDVTVYESRVAEISFEFVDGEVRGRVVRDAP